MQTARKLLDTGGPTAVTMRAIGAAVGITPMAIYRHYRDRDTLLTVLADQGFADLAHWMEALTLRGTVEARLMQVCDLCLDYAVTHPRLYELMFVAPREGARQYPDDFQAGRSPTLNCIAAQIRAGIDQGLFRSKDEWEVSFQIAALSHGLLMLYLGGRIQTSLAEFRKMHRAAFSSLFHGLLR